MQDEMRTINIFEQEDDQPVKVSTSDIRTLAFSVEVWAMIMVEGTKQGRIEAAEAMREYAAKLRSQL